MSQRVGSEALGFVRRRRLARQLVVAEPLRVLLFGGVAVLRFDVGSDGGEGEGDGGEIIGKSENGGDVRDGVERQDEVAEGREDDRFRFGWSVWV